MPATVVTMWETHGSTMETVAARVAEILGIPVHRQGLTPAEIEELAAQDRTGLAADIARSLAAGTPAEAGSAQAEAALEEIARRNTEAVLERAEVGGVIMGRNGAFILRDRPNTLHVKLDGIVARRRELAADRRALQWDPQDIEAYDAILNTSSRDTEEIAQFVAVMARVKWSGS